MNATGFDLDEPKYDIARCTVARKSAERLREFIKSLVKQDFGENVIVDKFAVNNMAAANENYASTMLAVTVTMHSNKSGVRAVMYVVVKMLPLDGLFPGLFDSRVTFKKEIAAYEEILPAYQQLQRENGVPRDKVFDIYPKCYGTRMRDHDVMILMENLKIAGYSCGDRIEGLDLAHSEMAVRNLATFHALGIALKIKKPELFARFMTKANHLAYPANVITLGVKYMRKVALQSEKLSPFYQRIVVSSDIGMKKYDAFTPSPFGTICHVDFWVNNIMFRRDAEGNPNAVKFVDFQTYNYQSPVRDLIYFVISSTAKSVLLHHFDHLFQLYYERFVETLAEVNCDLTAFGRENFNAECKEWASAEALHCSMMLKVILHPVESESVAKSMEYFDNLELEACRERMTVMFQCFLERDWI